MNERFKFRVFDYDENKMIYFSDLFSVVKPHHDRSSMPNYYNAYEYHKTSEYMQSTGVKDKNDKLIYEGDILKVINGSINGIGLSDKWEVKWVGNGWNIDQWTFDSNHSYEVIGNIYENKELLGVEE